jgi:Domain of unknown function (DUF4352)
MSRRLLIVPVLAALTLMGCASKEKTPEAQLFSAGEKAQVGTLNYNLIDSQIATRLGDDPATARTPKDRFIIVQISISNAGNQDASIPGLTLVDDAGQTYNELADGTGVDKWLGIVRKVAAAQTETGFVLFDAPAKHYRLRLTDEFSPEVAIDMPLSFIHEQMQHFGSGPVDGSNADTPIPSK